jgi:O-antigen/teichoic acid export membrane protein
LLLLPLYVRKIKGSEYGMVALATIALTLICIVLKLGINHAFFRSYAESDDPARRRKLVGSTLLFLLVTTSISSLLIYLAAPQEAGIIFQGDVTRADLVRLVALNCFFEVMILVPDSILRATFRSARYSALNIAALAVQLAAIAYLVIEVAPNAHSVLLGRLIGTAFEALIFFYAARRELSLSFSAEMVRDMLAFGVPLIFGQLSLMLFMTVDRFFIETYHTRAEVGVYAMANTIVSAISILVTVPFSQVWTVMRFSVMNEEGANEYYSRVLTYVTFVGMFLALGLSAVAGDALHLRGLKSYWPAETIIPLLAFSMVLDGASRVLNIGFTIKKRTIFAPIVTMAALIVNVALNFLLIPQHGPLGAAIATLLSYFFFCGLRYWVSNRFVKVEYEWRRVFKLVLVGGVIISGFYAYDHYRDAGLLPENLYLSMVIKVAIALLFPIVLLALNFYDPGERRRIAQLIDMVRMKFTSPGSGGRASEPDARELRPEARVSEE